MKNMLTEEEIITSLKNRFGGKIYNVVIAKDRRVFVEVDRSIIREALSYMKNSLGFDHLSTITGLDSGRELELVYHIVRENSLVVSLKTKISKTDPRIDSVSDVYIVAELYEREVYDILGVKFEGHPNLSRLILPEDWPEDLHPLKKDVTLEQITLRIDWSRVEDK
jgi:NADH:ubiquinone oxidoreductase subunit C